MIFCGTKLHPQIDSISFFCPKKSLGRLLSTKFVSFKGTRSLKKVVFKYLTHSVSLHIHHVSTKYMISKTPMSQGFVKSLSWYCSLVIDSLINTILVPIVSSHQALTYLTSHEALSVTKSKLNTQGSILRAAFAPVGLRQ
jgi:hypothetical protein